MTITTKKIQKLRQETGVGIMSCKKALEEAKGDLKKAKALLRKRGQKIIEKRKEKKTLEGTIGCYLHFNRKIGALIEVNCETDFVSRSNEFQGLAHDLAMQVAATNPKYILPEEVPEKEKDKERKACALEFKDKPQKIIKKIAQGRIKKYCQDICLLKQPFIKNPSITVEEYIAEKAARLGEKIKVKRFVRMEI